MAHFEEASVTDLGNQMLNEMMAGKYVQVTKATAGEGTVDADSLHEQTELQDEKQTLSIIGDTVDETGRTIAIQVGNAESSYKMEQIGVFAKLTDEGEEHLLFILQDKNPITVPDKSAPTFMLNVYTHLNISNVGRFEVTIDKTGIVNIEFMNDAIETHNTAEDAHQDIRDELAALKAQTALEIGTVEITNANPYPFPPEAQTVDLKAERKNTDYTVTTEVSTSVGNVQAIEIYDKQTNGFKIRIDGSATSATVKYYVAGGMTE